MTTRRRGEGGGMSALVDSVMIAAVILGLLGLLVVFG